MGNPTHCTELTREERKEALQLRALGFGPTEIKRRVESLYPEAHKYHVSSYNKWLNSDDPEYLIVLEELRSKAKKKTFSNKNSRVLALLEVAETLLNEFRATKAKDQYKKRLEINREFRLTLIDIKNEVDPWNIEDPDVKSAYERFLETYRDFAPKGAQEMDEWPTAQPPAPLPS